VVDQTGDQPHLLADVPHVDPVERVERGLHKRPGVVQRGERDPGSSGNGDRLRIEGDLSRDVVAPVLPGNVVHAVRKGDFGIPAECGAHPRGVLAGHGGKVRIPALQVVPGVIEIALEEDPHALGVAGKVQPGEQIHVFAGTRLAVRDERQPREERGHALAHAGAAELVEMPVQPVPDARQTLEVGVGRKQPDGALRRMLLKDTGDLQEPGDPRGGLGARRQ